MGRKTDKAVGCAKREEYAYPQRAPGDAIKRRQQRGGPRDAPVECEEIEYQGTAPCRKQRNGSRRDGRSL